MSRRRRKTFGGTSGVRVQAVANGEGIEKIYPVKIAGVVAVPIRRSVVEARRLHKHLGAALEYIDAQEGAEQCQQ